MKKKLPYGLIFIFCLLCLPGLAQTSGGLWFKKTDTATIQDIFRFYGYEGEKGYLMIPGYAYPPLFFKTLPADFNKLKDENSRHALFIKILAPLALRLNGEILDERRRIEAVYKSFLAEGTLSADREKFVEEKAAKYDIFTRLKGHPRYKLLLKELLERVDIIPPSVMITAAALETNWGTSRPALEGNALYKKLEWHTQKGLKPQDEKEDDSYRIKIYPDLYASMSDFALKLNSQPAFKTMRRLRREVLSRGSTLQGTMLAHTLIWNSPLQNYAGIFEYTLAYYELNIIDKSSLNSKMIDKELPSGLAIFLEKSRL